MVGFMDLYCAKKSNTGTGRLELHALTSPSLYQSFDLQIGTPIGEADAANFEFAMGDYRGTGTPDLYCIKKSNAASGHVEVHVLTNSSGYQSFGTEIGTPISLADAPNFKFTIYDFNGTGSSDLFCLKKANTGSGRLEVHVVSGPSLYQSFSLQVGTPIDVADALNFDFALGPNGNSSAPDLYCFKRSNAASGTLEIHVLSGASNYQEFILHTPTPISQAEATNFDFAVGYNRSSDVPDVYCLKKKNTGTGRLEIHVLTGSANYQSFGTETGTPIGETDAAANFAFALPAVPFIDRVNLSFTHQQQSQFNWCWAACCSMIDEFYSPASFKTQCDIATATINQSNRAQTPPLPDVNCCSWLESVFTCDIGFTLPPPLKQVAHFVDDWDGNASLHAVLNQLDAGHPVLIAIDWTGGGGHAIVITGAWDHTVNLFGLMTLRGTLWVDDPWYGPGDYFYDYVALNYQGNGSWVETLPTV